MSWVYWLPKSRIRITKSDLVANYTEAAMSGEMREARAFPQYAALVSPSAHFLFFCREVFCGAFLGDSFLGRTTPVARASAQVRPVRRKLSSSGVPTSPSAARNRVARKRR